MDEEADADDIVIGDSKENEQVSHTDFDQDSRLKT